MPDMLIRDVPETTHEEMKRRAESAGMSLQVYVRDLLDAHVAKPFMTDWRDQVRALPPVQTTMTGVEAAAVSREDR